MRTTKTKNVLAVSRNLQEWDVRWKCREQFSVKQSAISFVLCGKLITVNIPFSVSRLPFAVGDLLSVSRKLSCFNQGVAA